MTLVKFNSDKNNSFNSIFTDSFFNGRDLSLVPAVNICEAAGHFEIELAAPGLTKDDFKINLERRMLTIAVQKEQSTTEEQKRFSRREFSYGAFTRSFTLPDSADENAIQAKYNNGILVVEIQKKEEARAVSRQISIS